MEHKRLKTSKRVFFFFLVYIWNKERWKVCACSAAKLVRYSQMINTVFVLLRSLPTRAAFSDFIDPNTEKRRL